MGVISKYWHTVRYLRPAQLYGRLWFKLARQRVDLRPAPPLRTPVGGWKEVARRSPSLIGPTRFQFLSEAHDISADGWDNPAHEKLWRYNLHYFDDLNARDAATRSEWHRALLSRWVRENPPGAGTAWEPYPASLRIVNWIKFALGGNSLSNETLASLAAQTRWLVKRLEIHLGGNHLFANAKALIFAGLFFEGDEADTWFERGMRILEREIPRQILPDGGQFELSTMYHALALEDMLDLWNAFNTLGGISPRWKPSVEDWQARIGSMRRWLSTMSHPDGEISYFNDASIGIAPPPGDLDSYARRLGFLDLPDRGESVTWLRNSGYIRVEQDDAVAILDVGRIGPDDLPGHAHADTLSFEFSVFGQRVLVNSGTSCYGTSPERLRQRGTLAHNTIAVDGQDSSEVWGGFRVARRARPVGLRVVLTPATEVYCGHDGYLRLPGRVQHWRRWKFGARTLEIEDTVSGEYEHAEAMFYLHPSIRLDVASQRDGHDNVVLLLPGKQRVRFSVEGGALRTEPSAWSPAFGRTERNLCVAVILRDRVLRTRIQWDD